MPVAIRHRVLGPQLSDAGASFAVRSSLADAIEVCLPDGRRGERRVALTRDADGVFGGRIEGVSAGQRYWLRAYGEHDPARGLFFDPRMRLTDPYARAIDGDAGVLVDETFEWGDDAPPATPLADSLIYEAHVRGFTRLHPLVPASLRGTYAGLAQPAVIDEILRLGVTAVELLPVQQFASEPVLLQRGLSNYWGYNTLGFFAPHAGYAATGAAGQQVREFKELVRALHAAGLEVICDVVYNHTAEGGSDGPLLSLRGLDNLAFYRLDPADPGRYDDVTGCGNTLDASKPAVIELVLDSLRYWVEEMHVDGFRFDLGVALGRDADGFDGAAPLLAQIADDPVLSRVKLIMEPWDVGPDGYRLGGFTAPYAEWNGGYRDVVRDVWRGLAPTSELARALAGSSDTFAPSGRGPLASINLLTAHDGFTLRDLVSYDAKHNGRNGEANRDGDNANRSWNSGAEGPSDDPAVNGLRRHRARALLATLLLSQGVPMLTAGDERGRTQGGNNNAYCQDSAVSWLDWQASDADLLAFTTQLIALRARHAVLRRTTFFEGEGEDFDGSPVDVRWFAADGTSMNGDWWQDGDARTLGVVLDGRAADAPDATLVLLLHAGSEAVEVTLPGSAPEALAVELDSTGERAPGDHVERRLALGPWSVLVLRAAG